MIGLFFRNSEAVLPCRRGSYVAIRSDKAKCFLMSLIRFFIPLLLPHLCSYITLHHLIVKSHPLKTYLKDEGNELPTNCKQLKLKSPHGNFLSRSSPRDSMPIDESRKPVAPLLGMPGGIWNSVSEDR